MSNVNHPSHYCDQVPGIECIDVTAHFNFNRGNIIKYAWRCGAKGKPVEDLKKVIKYAEFEIDRLVKQAVKKGRVIACEKYAKDDLAAECHCNDCYSKTFHTT